MYRLYEMTDNVEHETPGRYEPPGRENHTKQRKSEKSMSFCAGKSYQTGKSSEKYDDEKAKSILNSEESEKSMSHLGGISILNREKSEKV